MLIEDISIIGVSQAAARDSEQGFMHQYCQSASFSMCIARPKLGFCFAVRCTTFIWM